MTAAAVPTVKDQELMPFGLVESAGVNAVSYTHLTLPTKVEV